MSKKIIIALLLILAPVKAFADVQSWQDPDFDFASLNKVFIMPVESELKASNSLKPSKRLEKDLSEWAKDGIRTAYKKRTSPSLIVKSYEDLAGDMQFIYSDTKDWDRLFYSRASEMGYPVFVSMNVTQGFRTEHIPESIRTYTEYREIEKRDHNGRLIETIRIPEEKTEIIPAHDVTYLDTRCSSALYLTEDPNGDYVAAVEYSIYREYQGGSALQVVENIINASMQKLFEHADKKPAKTRPGTRVIKRK